MKGIRYISVLFGPQTSSSERKKNWLAIQTNQQLKLNPT